MRRFHNITVHESALLGLAMMLLLMDLRWIGAFLCSALVHEASHYLMLRLLRCEVRHISVGITGAKMATSPLTEKEELLSALAGPIGGLLLIPLSAVFPRLALCAFFHSVVNLLPIYPLDGGRVLHCVLPKSACRPVQLILTVSLLIIAFRYVGWVGTLRVFLITQRSLLEKLLAKNRFSGYNRPTIN